MIDWITLINSAQLDDALAGNAPVLLFKHSTRCNISTAVLGRLERGWDAAKAGPLQPYYLDLLKNRSLSDRIATTLGVTHQSPQAIVVLGGKVVYQASHMDIRVDDIVRAVA